MKKNLMILMLCILNSGICFGQGGESTKKEEAIKSDAVKGGNFLFNLEGEPTTLHPITSTDYYSARVHNYIMDSLMTRDGDTYEWKPRIADKVEISKDNMVFTFTLKKNVVFHDGKPLTAEDVKFSFDAIFDSKYNAAHLIPYYEGIQKVEIVDPYMLKFYAKDKYFKNFDVAAGLTIIPKHIYADVEKSRKMNREVVGCGPYVLKKYERGQKLILEKFDKWYGNTLPESKGIYNYNQITMKFVKDENPQLEMIKKGDLDYVDLSIEQYMKKTEGEIWKTKVHKFKVENSSPKGYGYVGFNFRKEIFQDKNVRLALAHLLNRDEMNKKFRFGLSMPATGPWYQQSEYASPNVKPIPFDPAKASALLTKAGWSDSDKNGILDKKIGDKKVDLKFTLIHANKDVEKYWTFYQEELKKAGIVLEIQYLEWNSFMKKMDEGDFDVAALGWGGGSIDMDPKQIWHSSSAVKGGSNFISYKNPEVDKLIEKARQEYDKKKRITMLRVVYEKIAEDVPYLFMFNDKYTFYAHTARIQKPKDTFKYEVGLDYWWMKP